MFTRCNTTMFTRRSTTLFPMCTTTMFTKCITTLFKRCCTTLFAKCTTTMFTRCNTTLFTSAAEHCSQSATTHCSHLLISWNNLCVLTRVGCHADIISFLYSILFRIQNQFSNNFLLTCRKTSKRKTKAISNIIHDVSTEQAGGRVSEGYVCSRHEANAFGGWVKPVRKTSEGLVSKPTHEVQENLPETAQPKDGGKQVLAVTMLY